MSRAIATALTGSVLVRVSHHSNGRRVSPTGRYRIVYMVLFPRVLRDTMLMRPQGESHPPSRVRSSGEGREVREGDCVLMLQLCTGTSLPAGKGREYGVSTGGDIPGGWCG